MKRTGNSKIAVVGWGRGMGHKGHMYLADAVIQQARDMKADPYFFISKTVGKDDPLYPEEKVKIYQRVFPQHATIFEPQGNINQALTDLAGLGYQGVVLVVGADQKESFQYLVRPNKEGVPVYETFGLKKIKVISRQETRSQFRNEEGPRATPMRQVLLDPNSTDEDKFKIWRRDMPEQLSDQEVMDLMHKAESRMLSVPPKLNRKTSATDKLKQQKLKEFITKIRPLLKEATTEKKLEVLRKLKEVSFFKFKPKKTSTNPKEKDEPMLGYGHFFKPDEQPKEQPKQYKGWAEYDKETNPERKDEVEEARIIDPHSKVDLYYIVPRTGDKQIVFQNIPFKMVDKAIMVLQSKYNKITAKDIEIRPSSHSEYKRSLDEFAPDGSGDDNEENMLYKYAKMWYNGDENTQLQVEQILAKSNWEIGEIENEEGGAFVVQSGDDNGDSYLGWTREQLQEVNEDYLEEK